jgi:hypothetical protein
MSDRPVASKPFSSRLVLWGVALLAARIVTGLLAQIDTIFILFAVIAAGTVICLLITRRRAALWTIPVWYLVYGSTRVVDFGEYGGSEFAYGALAYYWASSVIPVIILGIGLVSILTSER